MTIDRFDGHSTEFGLWLRGKLRKRIDPEPQTFLPEVIQKTNVDEIDSNLGFHATNLDYIWRRQYHYILLEEKRYGSIIKNGQHRTFAILDRALSNDPNYGGFWILKFENASPEDGKIWLSKFDRLDRDPLEREITIQQLVGFLKLDWMTKVFC